MRSLRLTFHTVIVALMLASCHVPPSEELFVRADQAVDGVYSFPLNMVDGTVTYAVWFYTVMGDIDIDNLPLEVRWISPKGYEYGETVSMPVGNPKGDRQLYRSKLIPKEYGEWTLNVRVLRELPGFRGIGVICERQNKEDGAR